MKKHILTKEQSDIVLLNREDILVKGIAGSGKTLVLLYKAKKLAEENPGENVIIFTFNKTLRKSSEEIIKKLNLPNLHVATFHSWAYRALMSTLGRKIVFPAKSDCFLSLAIKSISSNHRFIIEEKYFDFLKDEISWIKGKGISSLEEYMSTQRLGRGTEVRVGTQEKTIVFNIFSKYEEYKGYRTEFDDFAPKLFKNKEKIK
ncbi:MAG: UvrD-helicase domain-containing protein, partial [Fusobacteriaceae bacterium]